MHVYLDQNKWIDLARGVRDPVGHPEASALIAPLFDAVRAERLVLPLTFANLYETQKINDPKRRGDVGYVQALLSQGRAFRCRTARLREEFAAAIAKATERAPPALADGWFVTPSFLESVADEGGLPDDLQMPPSLAEAIRDFPAEMLFDYLVDMPDAQRKYAVQVFTEGSAKLCASIERRRHEHRDQPANMRRRIYDTLLLIDTIDLFLEAGRRLGLPWNAVGDVDARIVRQATRETPAFHVEREIVLRLEAQARAVEQNDLRDMQSFAAAIPYCDMVIAEAHFSSLARQCRFDKIYGVRIETDIRALGDLLKVLAPTG